LFEIVQREECRLRDAIDFRQKGFGEQRDAVCGASSAIDQVASEQIQGRSTLCGSNRNVLTIARQSSLLKGLIPSLQQQNHSCLLILYCSLRQFCKSYSMRV
jgi:hypothetical protein